MMTTLKKVLKDTTTLSDGQTYCVGRIFAFGASVNGIGLSIWDVVKHAAHFDWISYGTGMGSMAVGIGALLKIKASTEPDAPVPGKVEIAKVATPRESVSITTATETGGHQ